jgi:hypothetical protein
VKRRERETSRPAFRESSGIPRTSGVRERVASE